MEKGSGEYTKCRDQRASEAGSREPAVVAVAKGDSRGERGVEQIWR